MTFTVKTTKKPVIKKQFDEYFAVNVNGHLLKSLLQTEPLKKIYSLKWKNTYEENIWKIWMVDTSFRLSQFWGPQTTTKGLFTSDAFRVYQCGIVDPDTSPYLSFKMKMGFAFGLHKIKVLGRLLRTSELSISILKMIHAYV